MGTRDPKENFDVDIESWIFAITSCKEEFDSHTVHALIRQMSGTFLDAVKGLVAFDLVDLAFKLHKVTKESIALKEMVFYILAHLPNPKILNPQELEVFTKIVNSAKESYPEVVSRFEHRVKS